MKKKKIKKHRCISCKEMFPKNEIEYDVDPYNAEIDGGTKKVWECNYCRKQSAGDI